MEGFLSAHEVCVLSKRLKIEKHEKELQAIWKDIEAAIDKDWLHVVIYRKVSSGVIDFLKDKGYLVTTKPALHQLDQPSVNISWGHALDD